jgi:hypothetical protein
MTFGEILYYLKEGDIVARDLWGHKPWRGERSIRLEEEEDGEPYIAAFFDLGGLRPWIIECHDILASDWRILERRERKKEGGLSR